VDACEFKAVVAQVYGVDPTRRIHHAQPISPALMQKQSIRRLGSSIDGPVGASVACFLKQHLDHLVGLNG
jgi:hypothetical protein